MLCYVVMLCYVIIFGTPAQRRENYPVTRYLNVFEFRRHFNRDAVYISSVNEQTCTYGYILLTERFHMPTV